MRKSIIVFLVLIIVGLSFASCKVDDVTYCYHCGSLNINENGKEIINGRVYQRYECRSCYANFLIAEGSGGPR